MKYFEELTVQKNKRSNQVCGDAVVCRRSLNDTIFVLADGIGSGVYANIAATFCVERLATLLTSGLTLQKAAAMTAESMYRAHEEEMIFAAFIAVRLFSDGRFSVCSYEAPGPLLLSHGKAAPLPLHFISSGYETIAEAEGVLEEGDSLILFSDGASQAGMGGGSFGIGEQGIADYINRWYSRTPSLPALGEKVVNMTASFTGGQSVDDTTLSILTCRQARQLTVFSGPPADRRLDKAFARRFIETQGQVVICGSSTAQVIARETGREIKLKANDNDFSALPEYRMTGAALVTEGAMVLNQTYNILDEDPASFTERTLPQRLALLLLEADAVVFVLGGAMNEAHEDLRFKQAGVKPRRVIVKLIAENMRRKGKLVVEDEFSSWGGA